MRRVFAALALAACGTLPDPGEPRQDDDVRIIRHDQLVARTAKQMPIELPFGPGQNGTELVLGLLQQARNVGAPYVADLAFHMVVKQNGTWVECETVLGVGSPPPEPPAAGSFEPHEVSVVVDERDLTCQRVAYVHETTRRTADSRFDVGIGRSSESVPIDTIADSDRVEQCTADRVHHRVRRYDYQLDVGYVPPNWGYLGATYADGPVSESKPRCQAIDASSVGAKPVHRLTATLGLRGEIEQAEPVATPPKVLPK